MLILFILLYLFSSVMLIHLLGLLGWIIVVAGVAAFGFDAEIRKLMQTKKSIAFFGGIVAMLAIISGVVSLNSHHAEATNRIHVEKKRVPKKHDEMSFSSSSQSTSYESEQAVPSSESSVETATTSYSESTNTNYSYSQQADSSDASKISYADYSSNDQYTPTAQGTNPGDGQTAPTQVNETGPIKASVDGWYHVPGQAYYDRVNRVAQYFQTEQEAIDAGYKRSRY